VGVGDHPRGILSADFNGDGQADLAVTNEQDDDVSVLYGLVGGGFGQRGSVGVGSGAQGIVSADFNGDGRADLAVTKPGDDDVSVLYGQAVCPLTLVKPGIGEALSAGETYRLEWWGRDADTSVRLWCLGPAGLTVFAEGIVAGNGGYDWSSVGQSVGWHCFTAQIQRDGDTFFSTGPGWLRAVPEAGQPPGAEATSPPSRTAVPESAPFSPKVSWVAPVHGTEAAQGELLELRWETPVLCAPAATVDLLLLGRADREWRLLAGRIEAETREYLWNTSDYEPGEFRFGIHLRDGEDWSAVIPSDWIELLPSEIAAPAA
jgi:hypothetical protein